MLELLQPSEVRFRSDYHDSKNTVELALLLSWLYKGQQAIMLRDYLVYIVNILRAIRVFKGTSVCSFVAIKL